jgi:hypothetical protein
VTPSARTLAECRRRGWIAQVVEQTVPRTFVKRDLFSIIDIVAVGERSIIGIQATSGSNSAPRVTKILAEPRALRWLQAGARLEVWSWSKRGARGKRKTWTLRVETVRVEDFEQSKEAA